MHIESVTLQNFRCFGANPTTVTLGQDLTALIGANGAGKSAFIEALRRLFGVTREERTLSRADVHFGPNEKPDTVESREVVIDVVLALPELADAEADAEAVQTVPEVFRVMTAGSPGDPLKARLRLEALWKRGESFVDEIEADLYWVSTLGEVAFGDAGGAGLDKQHVSYSDRGKIQLVYIPATRDGVAVTRQALRQLLRRVERSGAFGDETEGEIQGISENLQEKMDELPALQWVAERLKKNWGLLHNAAHLKTPRLVVISQEFTQILRSLTAKLSPAPDGRERGIDELSEGQTSLFFLALAATLAQLEAELAKTPPPGGFTEMDISPAALTIYAVEEPENHLAPFYLSRLVNLLGELCKGPKAMGLITSHAPSVMRRIGPDWVRHFRLEPELLVSRVNRIRLPEDDEEAEKFVRQAVLSQPELYFASLVILGEGDSEEIIIPRVAKALGVDLDPAFTAFAPLGGRHVNHFWRLLNDLDIPVLTLLDFDLGRHGAGPLRLKYGHDQLTKIRDIEPPDGIAGDPERVRYWRGRREKGIRLWRRWLAKHGVIFSYPLDLDLMMIRAFPDAYGVPDAEAPEDMTKLESSVFGNGEGLAEYQQRAPEADHPTSEELVTYEQLFKKRSKPGSHIEALAKLADEDVVENCPRPLRDLINKAGRILRHRADDDEAEA
ncbi:MAG: AAA family ATPase [Rhizobiales bacterium]|nr:AAA family ATPase [Hyphomicrobiales bacterium]